MAKRGMADIMRQTGCLNYFGRDSTLQICCNASSDLSYLQAMAEAVMMNIVTSWAYDLSYATLLVGNPTSRELGPCRGRNPNDFRWGPRPRRGVACAPRLPKLALARARHEPDSRVCPNAGLNTLDII